MIVGPVIFLALSKASAALPDRFRPLSRLSDLLPVYTALLSRLADAGVQRVQLDEPALVSGSIEDEREWVLATAEEAYAALGGASDRPQAEPIAGLLPHQARQL